MKITRHNLPNLLTLSRIAFIPILALLIYLPFLWSAWLALFFYIWICVTDYLDGYLARKHNVTSSVGTFLDPIADKILIVSLLMVFVDVERLAGFMLLPVMIILIREFLISGLREYLGGREVKVPVIKIAKWKTAIQMVSLGFIIVAPVSLNLMYLGWAGILVAAALTAYTGYIYVNAAWEDLKREENESEDDTVGDDNEPF